MLLDSLKVVFILTQSGEVVGGGQVDLLNGLLATVSELKTYFMFLEIQVYLIHSFSTA